MTAETAGKKQTKICYEIMGKYRHTDDHAIESHTTVGIQKYIGPYYPPPNFPNGTTTSEVSEQLEDRRATQNEPGRLLPVEELEHYLVADPGTGQSDATEQGGVRGNHEPGLVLPQELWPAEGAAGFRRPPSR